LLYDHVEMQSKYLTIPHPRMHLRGFVLLPLFEINPEIIIGQRGKIADIIAKQDFTDVVQRVNAS
jgi:2-amino-4-hydroxy-6-hydroxymethyldihydropteridine diphosphokinase